MLTARLQQWTVRDVSRTPSVGLLTGPIGATHLSESFHIGVGNQQVDLFGKGFPGLFKYPHMLYPLAVQSRDQGLFQVGVQHLRRLEEIQLVDAELIDLGLAVRGMEAESKNKNKKET